MPGEPKEKAFLRSLYIASGKSFPLSVTASYCGHETNEEQLDGKLWQYAQANMPEEEAERFWEQVHSCKYCLQKLLTIQQGIKQATQEKGYSLDRIKNLIKQKSEAPIKQKSITNVLHVALNWVKDTLELLETTGMILALEPIPVTRSTDSKAPQIIKIDKEFEKCKTVLSVEQVAPKQCRIEVEIIPSHDWPVPDNFRVNLATSRRLLASSSLAENKTCFDRIVPGNYRVDLKAGLDVWGHITLDISSLPNND